MTDAADSNRYGLQESRSSFRPIVFLCSVLVHVAIAAMLLFTFHAVSPPALRSAGAPVVMELAPLETAAPPAKPDRRIDRPQDASMPRTVPSMPLPVSSEMDRTPLVGAAPNSVSQPAAISPTPQEIKQETAPPPLPTPPQDHSAAPVEGAANAAAVRESWEGRIMAILEKNKRFPAEARWNNQQDVILVRVAIDRKGQTSGVKILRSKHFLPLEGEVRALIVRVSPLPPPPTSITENPVIITVPIQFYLTS